MVQGWTEWWTYSDAEVKSSGELVVVNERWSSGGALKIQDEWEIEWWNIENKLRQIQVTTNAWSKEHFSHQDYVFLTRFLELPTLDLPIST